MNTSEDSVSIDSIDTDHGPEEERVYNSSPTEFDISLAEGQRGAQSSSPSFGSESFPSSPLSSQPPAPIRQMPASQPVLRSSIPQPTVPLPTSSTAPTAPPQNSISSPSISRPPLGAPIPAMKVPSFMTKDSSTPPQTRQASIPQSPPPSTERPAPAPLPTMKVPSFVSKTGPAVTPSKVAPSAPASSMAQPQKSIHTYASDVAEAMAQNHTSKTSMILAESRRKAGTESIGTAEEKHNGKKLLLMIGSLVLIGAGAFGAYYLYSISALAPANVAPAAPQAPTSLVPTDSQTIVPIDGLSPYTLQVAVRAEVAKAQAPNTMREIVLTEKSGTTQIQIPAQEIESLLDIGAPDILVRSLSDRWMLGVYADGAGAKSMFVVATTDFFQDAFAGMIQWEKVMADDLRQYLFSSAPLGIANVQPTAPTAVTAYQDLPDLNSVLPSLAQSTSTQATSTASKKPSSSVATPVVATSSQASAQSTSTASISSSTPPLQPEFTAISGTFVDRIVGNRDVREFHTTDGKTLFLYSFIDNARLVVAPDEATLAAILARVEDQTYVR